MNEESKHIIELDEEIKEELEKSMLKALLKIVLDEGCISRDVYYKVLADIDKIDKPL